MSTCPAAEALLAKLDPSTVCDQPGVPGSSPACSTCTASCSAEPADVDPAEAALFEEAGTEYLGLDLLGHEPGTCRPSCSPECFKAKIGSVGVVLPASFRAAK